jgi:hypothetical protein
MAGAIGLRGDHDAARLRALARRSEDANQTRRLLALAAIYDGGSRSEAAKIGGVGLQTVRDWVLAFNAEGPAGLVNGKAPDDRKKVAWDFVAHARVDGCGCSAIEINSHACRVPYYFTCIIGMSALNDASRVAFLV